MMDFDTLKLLMAPDEGEVFGHKESIKPQQTVLAFRHEMDRNL